MPATGDFSLHPIDFAIIVVYLATLVGIGIYHARRQKDLQEFLLADKLLPPVQGVLRHRAGRRAMFTQLP